MKKESKTNRTFIGGQALMEGVMMQGATSMAMAVRTEEGDVLVETKRLKGKRWYSRVPILRGCVAFVNSLITGTGTLLRSAEVIYPEEETPSKGAYAFSAFLGIAIAIGLFMLLPSYIASLIFPNPTDLGVLWYSLIEGGIRIALFVLYLFGVSRLKDIRRTFMYHGAEHRTINCFESGAELTPENVQKCSTRHNRCGTTFLFFVIIISILVFSLVTWVISELGWNIGTWGRFGVRIALLPLVAGLSYELLRFLAVLPDNKFVAIFRAPGLALQRLTTYPPEIDMAEVAITSFNLVREMDANPDMETRKFGEFTMPELKALVRKRLVKAGIEEESEVDWLICAALKIRRGELTTFGKTDLAQYRKVASLVQKRESGIPLDYITGFSEFYGLRLAVSEDVLIPRLDTEIVADEVIKYINSVDKKLAVLDLMTGSGCIALAVAKNTSADVTASDISEKALEVAKSNLKENATVILSDGFDSIDGKFDVIVSNPPYIASEVVDTLAPDVTCQPRLALDGGEDGLHHYRKIAIDAPSRLNENGMLFLEIGYDQRESVTAFLQQHFTDIVCKKDYAGNDRVIIARKK